jgi:hypothetical protein
MRYRKLDRTGLLVSEICLGTARRPGRASHHGDRENPCRIGRQIERPGSPSITRCSSFGRSPLRHSGTRCTTR